MCRQKRNQVSEQSNRNEKITLKKKRKKEERNEGREKACKMVTGTGKGVGDGCPWNWADGAQVLGPSTTKTHEQFTLLSDDSDSTWATLNNNNNKKEEEEEVKQLTNRPTL